MRSIRDVLSLLPPEKRDWGKLPATYTLTWLPIASGGAAVPDSLTTNSSSDFVALTMRAYSTTTATPPVEIATPQATVIFQISSNTLQPDNTPIPLALFTCNTNKSGEWELDFPLSIPRNTELTGQLTNLQGADMNVRIVLAGIRLLPNVITDLV